MFATKQKLGETWEPPMSSFLVYMRTEDIMKKDGKLLTLTTSGTNAKGEKMNNVVVYEKQ